MDGREHTDETARTGNIVHLWFSFDPSACTKLQLFAAFNPSKLEKRDDIREDWRNGEASSKEIPDDDDAGK